MTRILATVLIAAILQNDALRDLVSWAKRICTRPQHALSPDTTFFQRTQLSSAEACVERCIENLAFCKSAAYAEKVGKPGICMLYAVNSATDPHALHPDASVDPISTVYELLDACPSHSKDEMLSRIAPEMRRLLEERKGSRSVETASSSSSEFDERKKDISFDRDRFDEETTVYRRKPEEEGYAMMQQLDEHRRPMHNAHGHNGHRNPFDPSVGTHIGSSAERGSGGGGRRRPEYGPSHSHSSSPQHESTAEFPPISQLTPIKPVQVLHFGLPTLPTLPTLPPLPTLPTLPTLPPPGSPQVSMMVQSPSVHMQSDHPRDGAPCPARRGDPCAPKRHFTVDSPPVHIEARWSEWGGCSATCGGGQRTRQCRDSSDCLGDSVQSCATHACPEWMSWSAWSPCTTTCGPAEKQRTRRCTVDRGCEGVSVEVDACHQPSCSTWSSWAEWAGCSVTCGLGNERRFRACEGAGCLGQAFEQRLCAPGACPSWGGWGPWKECSQSCGGGNMERSRACLGGSHCDGDSVMSQPCNVHPCPEWGAWNEWGGRCGCDDRREDEDQVRIRNRVCMYRQLPFGGCEGPAQDQSSCPSLLCPTWTEWREWGECSTSCGQGTQKRVRECENSERGACRGNDSEMRFCQVAVCPYWGEWSDWSGCSVTCGVGTCDRSRKCIVDELLALPSIDEIEEAGEGSREADDHAVEKAALIARARKLARVMMGERTRNGSRSSSGSSELMEPSCQGSAIDRKTCDAGACCGWDEWTEWSPCIGCGAEAVSKRVRTCGEGSSASSMPPMQFMVDASGQTVQSDTLGTVRGGGGVSATRYQAGPVGGSVGNTHYIPASSPVFAGLQRIVPVNGRKKRMAEQCMCSGPALDTRPCASSCAASMDRPTRECAWSEWGEWCGCDRCRSGRERRRRFCDRSPARGGGPAMPDPSCSCMGGDTEERGCRIGADCSPFSSSDREVQSTSAFRSETNRDRERERGDEGEGADAESRGRGGDVITADNHLSIVRGETLEEDGNSDAYTTARREGAREGKDEYVPIKTGITVSHQEQTYETGAVFEERDSPITTTQYPYKVCRWSKWAEWSTCQTTRQRQRNRFCIGAGELVSDCQCSGLSTEEKPCEEGEASQDTEDISVKGALHETMVNGLTKIRAFSTGDDAAEERSDELTSSEAASLETAIDKEVDKDNSAETEGDDFAETFERASLKRQKSRPSKECDWARWSQWSDCTTTCGPGQRLRRRRCPCGDDTRCGDGTSASSEQCEKQQCPDGKRPYPFFGLSKLFS